jgi:hypothetical protein
VSSSIYLFHCCTLNEINVQLDDVTFNFSKIIDERMTVTKGTNIVDPYLWRFDLHAHLTFVKCAASFFFTNDFRFHIHRGLIFRDTTLRNRIPSNSQVIMAVLHGMLKRRSKVSISFILLIDEGSDKFFFCFSFVLCSM